MQKRQAQHVEKGYEQRGVSTGTAKRRAWATVNKQSGGGNKKTSSSRGRSTQRSRSSHKRSSQQALALSRPVACTIVACTLRRKVGQGGPSQFPANEGWRERRRPR